MTNFINLIKAQNRKVKETAAGKKSTVKFAPTDSIYYSIDEEDDSPFLVIVDAKDKPRGMFVSNDTEDGFKFMAGFRADALDMYKEGAKKYPISKLETVKANALKTFMAAIGKTQKEEPVAKSEGTKKTKSPAMQEKIKQAKSKLTTLKKNVKVQEFIKLSKQLEKWNKV